MHGQSIKLHTTFAGFTGFDLHLGIRNTYVVNVVFRETEGANSMRDVIGTYVHLKPTI